MHASAAAPGHTATAHAHSVGLSTAKARPQVRLLTVGSCGAGASEVDEGVAGRDAGFFVKNAGAGDSTRQGLDYQTWRHGGARAGRESMFDRADHRHFQQNLAAREQGLPRCARGGAVPAGSHDPKDAVHCFETRR